MKVVQELVQYFDRRGQLTRKQIHALLEQGFLAGEAPNTLWAKEYCSNCARPLFTHKRNFQLVDNILYSDPEASGRPRLNARIDFDDPALNAGIGDDTYFSDHFPIWSRFRLS